MRNVKVADQAPQKKWGALAHAPYGKSRTRPGKGPHAVREPRVSHPAGEVTAGDFALLSTVIKQAHSFLTFCTVITYC